LAEDGDDDGFFDEDEVDLEAFFFVIPSSLRSRLTSREERLVSVSFLACATAYLAMQLAKSVLVMGGRFSFLRWRLSSLANRSAKKLKWKQ